MNLRVSKDIEEGRLICFQVTDIDVAKLILEFLFTVFNVPHVHPQQDVQRINRYFWSHCSLRISCRRRFFTTFNPSVTLICEF